RAGFARDLRQLRVGEVGRRAAEVEIELDLLLGAHAGILYARVAAQMIQLHYYPGNASFAPHLLLEELGTPFELQYVDRTVAAHKSPAYLKLNPNGLIPVLVDGDLVLYETAAICLLLADTHPKSGLAPAAGSPERAHFYKWLVWMTNSVQATLSPYFYPDRWVKEGNAAGAA